MSKILLIGYGAIGQYVFEYLQTSRHSSIAAVLCRTGREQCARAALHPDIICVSNVANVDVPFDLAIECAGHSALSQHVPGILRAGIDVMCVSTGALSNQTTAAELEQAASLGGSHLHLLSGAIGALDALSAAKSGGLESVMYRGRKPPAGWKGSPAEHVINLDNVTNAVTHFTGSAREAAQVFPKNANVAASVAMAGLGFDNTRVELIADPHLSSNRHEVEASGRFGHFTFSIDGTPLPDNPRSSALTAMSIVEAIERRNSPIRIA